MEVILGFLVFYGVFLEQCEQSCVFHLETCSGINQLFQPILIVEIVGNFSLEGFKVDTFSTI